MLNLSVAWLALATTVLPTPLPPDPATEGLARAEAMIEKGDVSEAQILLRSLIEQDPNSIDAGLLLARTWLADQPARARLAAIEVLRRHPENRRALDLLSASYARARALGLTRAGEIRLRRQEIADYERLLAVDPDAVDVLYRSASQRLALERLLPQAEHERRRALLRSATAELERVVSRLHDHSVVAELAAAHFQLGRAYKHQADFLNTTQLNASEARKLYRRAVDQFNQALEADPDRIDAVGEIVLIHRGAGERQAAIQVVRGHLENTGAARARAKLYSLLGNLLAETGRDSDAIEAFEKVLEFDDRLMDTYLGLYQIHSLRGDSARAEEVMQTALRVEPGFLTGYLHLGRSSFDKGDHDAATRHFESVFRVAPSDAVVLGMIPSQNVYRNRLYYDAAAWLAWLYLEHRGEPDKALQAIETAKRFSSPDPRLQDTQGWAYFRLGEYAKAREILEKTARQSGDFPAVHYHLAKTYYMLGDHAAAARAVEKALAFRSDFPGRRDAERLRAELQSKLKS